MAAPAIVVSRGSTLLEGPVLLHAGVKPRRSFCNRILRKCSKNAASAAATAATAPQQQGEDHRAHGDIRRSRSASPSSAKRKDVPSPASLKRKYLRKVKFPAVPHLSFGKGRKASPGEAAVQATQSTFEEELAGQENQSPNDPEFLRRASERWRRRTGAGQPQPSPHLLGQNTAALQPTLQWPSSPSQQQAFQRRVSPRPVVYGESPFSSVPTSPTPFRSVQTSPTPFSSVPTSPTLGGASTFRRCNTQYSSLSKANTESSFKRSAHSFTSLSSFARSHMGLGSRELSPCRSPKPARPPARAAAKCVAPAPKYLAPAGPGVGGAPQPLYRHMSFDDTVAEELKKAAKKAQQLSIPDNSSGKVPFRRLSSRLRRSLRSGRHSTNSSTGSSSTDSSATPATTTTTTGNSDSGRSSDSGGMRRNKTFSALSSTLSSSTLSSSSSFYYSDNTPMEFSSFTSSMSCQSFLSFSSGYSSPGSSTPSSPATAPRHLSGHRSRAAGGLPLRVTFQDIFLEEPQIAEKFAIMFPSEPRPEWHRHLRQVLNKAGQKIFKKGEAHDTTIPENLRHQLKHIYVY